MFSLNSVLSQENTVEEILIKAQGVINNQNNLSCDLKYNYYTSYDSSKPYQSHNGRLVKNLNNFLLKIHSTIFLSDQLNNMSLKLNEDQKAMVVSKSNINLDQANPIDNTQLLKQFKTYKLIENKNYWICVFIAPDITQLPYSKIEVEINKTNFLVNKQTLYFSARMPYFDDENNEKYGNPKLEIIMSNFKNSITVEEKNKTNIKSFININPNKISGKNQYKDYTVIEN